MTKALSQIQNTQRPKSIRSYFFSLGLVFFSLHLSRCNEGFSAATTPLYHLAGSFLSIELRKTRERMRAKSNLG